MTEAGTNGGAGGTSGGRRRLAAILLAAFLVILAVVTIGNAESMASDFAAAGVRESRAHIWTWEVSSVLAWLSVTPAIWWCVTHLRPPRIRWPAVALAALIGLPLASAWHIGAMIGLRHLAYAAMGEHYTFAGSLADPYLYEFRKDVATYLQFTSFAALSAWLLGRVDPPAAAEAPAAPATGRPTCTVTDGGKRYLLPVEAIEQVAAAGNYVEVHAAGRVLLHRATLSGIERELGPEFVRVHRSRLVRRAAIRSVRTDRSGDLSLELESGAVVAGSRRYARALLDG